MDTRYARIKTKFWTDEKVRAWDSDTRLLALYLLTSPHSNMLGCYVLPKLYACEDLGWEPARLDKALDRLIADGFAEYDQVARLVYIPNYLKHNPIENENQAKAAAKQLAELPRSPLLWKLIQYLEQLGKGYLKPLLEQLAEQMPEPITVTITESVTVTKESPDANASGGYADAEPDGSDQGNEGASASEPILEQAIQLEQEQPALVAQSKKRKQTKPVYGEAERALVDKMRQWREEQNCPPTQKDWHLRELAIVAKLLKTYPAEELEACFLAAREDEYWRTRLDSWATIERYLPRWRLQQARDRPEGLRVPKAWHKLKRYFQGGGGSDEGGSGEASGFHYGHLP